MKSIIINDGETKLVLLTDEINNNQIFNLVGFIQKNLHQSSNKLTGEGLIKQLKTQLDINFISTNLVAEININKP